MFLIKIFLFLLTLLSIFLGIKIRRSNLGWIWFVGFVTMGLFGVLHSICMTYFIFTNAVNAQLIWITLLGNLIFLGTLIFQTDGGDSGSVVAIDEASGNSFFRSNYALAWKLTFSFMALFVAQNLYLLDII